MNDSGCPNNNGGEHRYFIFKTQWEFDPVENAIEVYTRREYAILGCNCGSTIKTIVKKQS